MTITHGLRIRSRISLFAAVGATVFLLVACQPILDPAVLEAVQTLPETTQDAVEESPNLSVEPAKATVNTRSLRVREAPNEDSEMIAGIKQGTTYPVLGISSDGAWIQLEVPETPDGNGWVASNFVTLEGDITNIETVEVIAGSAASQEDATEETAMEDDAAAEADDTTEETAMEDDAAAEADDTTEETAAEDDAAAEADDTAEESAMEDDAEAEATVEAPAAGLVIINSEDLPLRVRSAPTTEEDNKIGNVFHEEVYEVLEISEDGEWVRISVPELDPENGGWVSAEYVVLGE